MSKPPNPTGHPTLQMVADLAKVSRETVSHILGGKRTDRYRESTRRRVEQIARDLNYRPHRGAQMMKSGRSNLIAIVHFGAGIEAARKTNQTLARLLQKTGYDYLAVDMNWHDGNVDRTIAELIRSRVEGILISHIQATFEDEHIDDLLRAGIPVVLVNGERRCNAPLVSNNATDAVETMTDQLFASGHRLILQLMEGFSGLPTSQRPLSWSQRVTGFQRACRRHGTWTLLQEEEFFSSWPRWAAERGSGHWGLTVEQDAKLYAAVDKPVYHLCSRLFSQGPLPDAIVCRNDFYAMEAIAAGLEHGIAIPQDLAITGYDNDRIGTFPAFGITTAEQDIEKICAEAMRLLLQRLKDPQAPMAKEVLFPSHVILRTSSAAEAARNTRPTDNPRQKSTGKQKPV